MNKKSEQATSPDQGCSGPEVQASHLDARALYTRTHLASADGVGYRFSLFQPNLKERDLLPSFDRGIPVASVF